MLNQLGHVVSRGGVEAEKEEAKGKLKVLSWHSRKTESVFSGVKGRFLPLSVGVLALFECL